MLQQLNSVRSSYPIMIVARFGTWGYSLLGDKKYDFFGLLQIIKIFNSNDGICFLMMVW